MNEIKQLGILLACAAAGEALSLLLGGRLPAGVLGLTVLLLLLAGRRLHPRRIEGAADFLLRNMAFFFLPACLGVLDIFDEIRSEALAILAVCLLTTFCTAAAAALTMRAVLHLQRRAKEGGKRHE